MYIHYYNIINETFIYFMHLNNIVKVGKMDENEKRKPIYICGHCGRKVSHVDDMSGWCDICEEEYRQQQNAWAMQDARED